MENLTINIILNPEMTKSDVRDFILDMMNETIDRGCAITDASVDGTKVLNSIAENKGDKTGFTEEFLK